MIFNGSRRFSMFLSALLVLSGSQWFSQVLSGSRRLSFVLNVSHWFLLVLIGFQCSHRFTVVLAGFQWFS